MKRGMYHIALAILALTLPACAPFTRYTPASLMRSSPDLSGTLLGDHVALARCAFHALKDHYANFGWDFDLQEFPREDRTPPLAPPLEGIERRGWPSVTLVRRQGNGGRGEGWPGLSERKQRSKKP